MFQIGEIVLLLTDGAAGPVGAEVVIEEIGYAVYTINNSPLQAGPVYVIRSERGSFWCPEHELRKRPPREPLAKWSDVPHFDRITAPRRNLEIA